ncbi:hypothetical protein LSH36_107g03011 [Paralvinella palmiformis]|uniref:EGF-like domain-containing protein n=1 Tax=Paralvinella palmiformis TaxID=53620 RepID=A0AAD9JZ68_9ANNE|nr:hypothetical protein LSH36_107g03011 [Paralvinella palmiformis]
MLIVVITDVIFVLLVGMPSARCEDCTCGYPRGICEGFNDDTCFCYAGYYGSNCSEHKNQCFECDIGSACSDSGTCEVCDPECPVAKGKCTSSPGGPKCRCIKGWAGPVCGTDISTWTSTVKPETGSSNRVDVQREIVLICTLIVHWIGAIYCR